jgi:hypothetical protein
MAVLRKQQPKRLRKAGKRKEGSVRATTRPPLAWSLPDLTDLSTWPTYPNGDYADLAHPIPPLPWTDEVKRKWADLSSRLQVEEYRRRYLKTGNPVYAWRAYAECRSAHRDIPDWVLEYLDEPARAFWRWSMVGRPPKELGEALADALLMRRPGRKGPGTVFAEVFPDKESRALAVEVYQRVRAGEKPYLAVENAAKTAGVSRSTVQRAWDRHMDEFRATEQELGLPTTKALLSKSGV